MCYDVSAASTIWQPCRVQVQKQTTSWDYGYTILLELCFRKAKNEKEMTPMLQLAYIMVLLRLQTGLSVYVMLE